MRWALILMTMFQLGCAGSPLHEPIEVLAGDSEALLEAVFATPADPKAHGENAHITSAGDTGNHADQLLSLSPEMKAFVDTIDPALTPNQRFRRLLRTLRMEGFELEYDLDSTTTAAEAFAQRRGNCISFAALVVALAREVGLEAHFNQVHAPMERRATTNGRGQLLVQGIQHINAEVSFGWSSRIFEFNFERPLHYRHEVLTDEAVQSLYLNNRALELVKAERLEGALSLLEEALSLTPDVSLLWNSLGYVHRKSGNLELAELSYTQAIALDEGNTAAENNLRRLYQLQSQRILSQAIDARDSAAKES